MDFKQYQKRGYTAINPHTDLQDEILNWAVGLAEEAGEVMGCIKHGIWGREGLDRVAIAKEIGDVLWYAAALCTVLKLDMGVVAELNVSKLEHRFGSGVFTTKESKDRHGAERKFAETDLFKDLMKRLYLK